MTTTSYKTCNTSNMSTHLWPKHEIISSGSSSGPTETAMAEINLPISVTKTSQMRVSDTMFGEGSTIFQLS